MICAICGGPVEWQGPMSALSHTQCLSCGQTNCQTSEGDESNEEKKGEYRSASCDDVARRVDECMALRQIDREKVRDAIADALGCMIYCCTRAWEAWSVGTMRREDFILASEDDGILDELTAAAISAIEAKPGSAS